MTVALCLITSGAVVYGIQHFDPHRWGEVLGYAVGTVALAALGCLPFAGPSARWLNNYRAAAAAYRLAHRPVPAASPSAGQPSSPIGTSDSPTTTTVSTTSAHDDA